MPPLNLAFGLRCEFHAVRASWYARQCAKPSVKTTILIMFDHFQGHPQQLAPTFSNGFRQAKHQSQPGTSRTAVPAGIGFVLRPRLKGSIDPDSKRQRFSNGPMGCG